MQIVDTLNEFLSKSISEYSENGHKATLDGENNGLSDISYYTYWYNDFSDEFGSFPFFYKISQPDIAPGIRKVSITAEDEGVNGTHNWDLETLITAKPVFENLEEFHLPLNEADTHHRKIVTYQDSYDENGGLGLLLNACPKLKVLTAPSAPGANFFEREKHPLQELNLQSGYTHQNFIKNLAASSSFPELRKLTFRDYAETYMDDYEKNCVPYEQYEALFNAQNLPALKDVTLIDTVLSQEQKDALTALAIGKNISLAFSSLS